MPNELKNGSNPKWLRNIAGWSHYQPTLPRIQPSALQTKSSGGSDADGLLTGTATLYPSKNFNSKVHSRRLCQHTAERTPRECNPGEKTRSSLRTSRAHGKQDGGPIKSPPAGSSHGLQASGFHKTLQVQPSIEAKQSIRANTHPICLHPHTPRSACIVAWCWNCLYSCGPLASHRHWKTSGSMSSLSKRVTTTSTKRATTVHTMRVTWSQHEASRVVMRTPSFQSKMRLSDTEAGIACILILTLTSIQ